MSTITAKLVMRATSWADLNLPHDAKGLRSAQRAVHPDVCLEDDAHDAFTKLTVLFEAPDMDLRLAKGSFKGGKVEWKFDTHDQDLADENHGTAPHTTWSTTTPDNARMLCAQAGIKNVTSWGAIRAYATRHGHGPLPGEGIVAVPEPHNNTTEWAGAFRTGAWESSVLEKAIEVTGVDKLSISWADLFDGIVTTEGVVPWNAFAPVGLLAKGPQRTDREFVS